MTCQSTADRLTLGLFSSLRAGQLVGTLVSRKRLFLGPDLSLYSLTPCRLVFRIGL